MRISITAVGFMFLASVGCASASSDDGETTSDELRTMTAAERVGDLAFGESKVVPYTDAPLYRALRVHAEVGDLLDVSVRGAGLDPKLWILRASDSHTMASNDDSDASTHDSHVEWTASAAGDYLVVFRDKNREDGSFTVTLADRTGSATPPTPPPSENLHGFVSGARMVARGSGSHESNDGPSYQCHRKTKTNMLCGGWAIVTSEAGHTDVAFGIVGDYDYWAEVTGHDYYTGMNQVPPPASSRFWDQVGSVALDASGHASLDRVTRDSSGAVSRTSHYDVSAGDGSITIAYDSQGDTRSCSHYDETCTIRVLSH